MSTEYYIVAKKDDDLIIFDGLYKGKRTILAMAPNWKIEDVIKDYEYELQYGYNTPEDVKHDALLLLKLINFIYLHSGYTYTIMTDNELIDYLYTIYDEWSWKDLKYYS